MSGESADGAWRSSVLARDVIAGLFLIVIAAVAYVASSGLAASEGSGIGPGLMPRGVSALMAMIGAAIAVLGFLGDRQPIGGVAWRGPIFVLGAVALFAASVRTLGLAFAGPIAVIVSALADKESRLGEIIIYAIVLTVLCVGLFKYILRLPIPLAPMLLGY